MAGAARGETMRRIAEHMQALSFKLRRGKRWNPGTVWRVIRRQEFLAKKRALLSPASTPMDGGTRLQAPLIYAQGI